MIETTLNYIELFLLKLLNWKRVARNTKDVLNYFSNQPNFADQSSQTEIWSDQASMEEDLENTHENETHDGRSDNI